MQTATSTAASSSLRVVSSLRSIKLPFPTQSSRHVPLFHIEGLSLVALAQFTVTLFVTRLLRPWLSLLLLCHDALFVATWLETSLRPRRKSDYSTLVSQSPAE